MEGPLARSARVSVTTERRSAGIAGRRILITREADDARRWAHRLATAGALPIVFPCIMCEPITDADTMTRFDAAFDACDWIVLTSVRGVEALAALLERRVPKANLREQLGRRCIAAVGPSTALATSRHFGRVDLVAGRATGADLGADLGARLAGTGKVVLVLGAEGGRTDVESALAVANVPCSRVNIYRTLPIAGPRTPRDLAAEGVQDILLASPSAVAGLCNAAVIPQDARIVTIGPTTTSAARDAGLRVWAEARQPSLEGMLEALQ